MRGVVTRCIKTPTKVGGLRIYRISNTIYTIVTNLQPPLITAVFLLNPKLWRGEMVVMVDARQYGDCVKCARGMLGLSYDDAAKLL